MPGAGVESFCHRIGANAFLTRSGMQRLALHDTIDMETTHTVAAISTANVAHVTTSVMSFGAAAGGSLRLLWLPDATRNSCN
jgi:hypothetical protein